MALRGASGRVRTCTTTRSARGASCPRPCEGVRRGSGKGQERVRKGSGKGQERVRRGFAGGQKYNTMRCTSFGSCIQPASESLRRR
eukprot:1190250-Prorocentrum_minimum.AAC.7